MDGDTLKLLYLEDSPMDAMLALRMVEGQGLIADWTVVGDEQAYREALNDRWDVILLDYNLPGYSGMEALALAKEVVPRVPVVFLSGSIGEEQAVECITAGATDYVLKDKAYRLGPVIQRAIIEAETKVARLKAEEQVRIDLARMERALDALFQGVLAMGGTITGEHGVGLAKKRWWPQAVEAGADELHRRIKRALDPEDLLNPGKFL